MNGRFGYRSSMTTAPFEPVGDPELTPDGPDPIAPGNPEEPEPSAQPEES